MKKLMVKDKVIIFSFCLVAAVGCAKIGAPTGGPKDADPPKLERADPENYSLNFDKKKIEIWFDEYIQLKDANQQLVVSPPMSKKPGLMLKAKSFVIEFKDTLKPNTTYALNFGNSIVDNNEGNPIENFRYVFSTGTFIDSMSVQGNAIGAFDLKPDKDPLIILLHENLDDTAVYKSMPVYVGRTGKDGSYRIDNMREGKFHLYAIKDANSNLRYDPVTEPIAFIDTVLELTYKKMTVDTDTVKKPKPAVKKAEVKKDSTKKDTAKIVRKPKPMPSIKLPQLYFFTEKNIHQYIKNSDRKDKRKLDVIFNIPQKPDFLYQGVGFDLGLKRLLLERNQTYDSLTFWVLDSTLYKSDSISLSFHYYLPDSGFFITDTIKFNFSNAAGETKKKKQDKNEPEKNNLTITPASGSTLDLNSRIVIQSDKPLLKIDTSFVDLIERIDTLTYERSFSYSRDSINPRKVYINYPWKPETSYQLKVYPGFATDYYDCATDTMLIKYTVQKEEFYGNLILKIRQVRSPMVIQMSDKNLISERYITCDTTLTYRLMKPGSYSFKGIFDDNKNNIWDTGDLLKRVQPEKVIFMDETATVRSNWDVEKTWIIKK